MRRLIQSAVIYYAIVFAIAFALGVFRTLLVEPKLGVRMAELVEMPAMLAVIGFTALRLFGMSDARQPTIELGCIGLLALTLMLSTEVILVLNLRGISIVEYVKGRDPVSGAVYILLLLIFAAMPWIVGRKSRSKSS